MIIMSGRVIEEIDLTADNDDGCDNFPTVHVFARTLPTSIDAAATTAAITSTRTSGKNDSISLSKTTSTVDSKISSKPEIIEIDDDDDENDEPTLNPLNSIKESKVEADDFSQKVQFRSQRFPSLKRKRSNSNCISWEEQFFALNKFQMEHGHCNVRQDQDEKLLRWIRTNREEQILRLKGIRSKILTEDRKKKLDNIGFSWNIKLDEFDWNDIFKEMCAYHDKHKSWNVSDNENPTLHRWFWKQRKNYRLLKEKKRTLLTHEQIKLLNAVHFDWGSERASSKSSKSDYAWFEKFDQLERVNNRMQANKQLERGLHLWQETQRHQYWDRKNGKQSILTDERIHLLNKLGFNWSFTAKKKIKFVHDLTTSDEENKNRGTRQEIPIFDHFRNVGKRRSENQCHESELRSKESRFVFVRNQSQVPIDSQTRLNHKKPKKAMFNVSIFDAHYKATVDDRFDAS